MKKIFFAIVAVAGLTFTSCDLDEVNPSAGDASLNGFGAWSGLQAYCYSCLNDQLYTASDWMYASEGGTDLWTTRNNSTSYRQVFYYADLIPSYNTTNKLFKQCYSMLTTCNTVINEAANVTIDRDEDAVTVLTAETKALRAFYYYILVSNFGPVTLTLESNASVSGVVERRPVRTSEKLIYEQIIKDLTEAIKDLPVTPYGGNKDRFTKKAAMGLLARVYAQRAGLGESKYDDAQTYWTLCRDTAKELIDNMAAYGAHLYDDIYDMWADANNRDNKEALLMVSGADPYDASYQYSSKNNKLSAYSCADPGALSEFWPKSHKPSDKNNYLYGRLNSSNWMPTKYLLYRFDPTWDKRWETTWQYAHVDYSAEQTTWWGNAGEAFKLGCITITEAMCTKYGIDPSNIGKTMAPYADATYKTPTFGNNQFPAKVWPKGITIEQLYEYDEQTGEIVKDANGKPELNLNVINGLLQTVDEVGTRKIYSIPYPVDVDDNRIRILAVHNDSELQKYKDAKSPFFVFKLSDLYGSNGMPYGTIDNGSEAASAPNIGNGATSAHRAYPHLIKFNWNYDGVFTTGSHMQVKVGTMFIMRMAEVYLLAAEAEAMLGNTGAAATYLNPLRQRAAREGAAESAWKLSSADMNVVFDEYAREMAGEFQRWALLKRHNAFEERLALYNPKAAQHFKPHHYNRPIGNDFLMTILNAEEYGDNGYGTTAKSGLEDFE